MSIIISPETDLVRGMAGGALIAASSTIFVALTGKLSGMSGILHQIIVGKANANRGWRVSYVAGLVGAGCIIFAMNPSSFGPPHTLSPLGAALAGLLVGVGTRLSGGCTSGHGICGLPRLSPRSLVAVGTFMATGMAAAVAVSSTPALNKMLHGGFPSSGTLARVAEMPLLPTGLAVAISAWLFRRHWLSFPDKSDGPAFHAAAAGAGLLFGLGLGVSGMTNHAKVTGFLNPWAPGGWDPSLMGVMGAGVLINTLTFRWLSTIVTKPLLDVHAGTGEEEGTLSQCLPMGPGGKCKGIDNSKVDVKLIGGAALFGMGWGIGGICPGPSIVSLAAGGAANAILFPAILLGMAAFELLNN